MNTHDIKRYAVSGDIAYPVCEDLEGDYVTYEDHVAAIEADRKQCSFTKPSTNQDWLSLDPAVAFHLIERHAENWNDAGAMMQAYVDAHIEADRKRSVLGIAWRNLKDENEALREELDRKRRGEPVLDRADLAFILDELRQASLYRAANLVADALHAPQPAEPVKVPSDEVDLEEVRRYLDDWGCLDHPGVRALLAYYDQHAEQVEVPSEDGGET